MSLHIPIQHALQRGDAAEAARMAREAVAADASDMHAHRLLALALATQGDTAQAHASLDRAMALAPDDAALHAHRAALMLADDRPDDVQQSLQRSMQLDPNSLPAYLMQAQMALRSGQVDETARLCRIAARIDPEHPVLLTLEALLALQTGQPAQGLRLASRAAELRADHPPTLHVLAMAYLANDHVAFAEQALRRLLELRGDDLRMRRMLAHLIERQGRPGEAADLLAAGQDDGSIEHGLVMAGLRLAAGQADQARTVLERRLDSHPQDERLTQAWLHALMQLPSAGQRIEAVERRLQAQPDNILLWASRMQVASDVDDAEQVAGRLQQAMPDSVPALFAQMQLAQARQQHERAEQLAQAIVEQEPGHLAAQSVLVDALLQRAPDEAVAHVQALLDRGDSPATRLLYGWLGHACDRAGRHAQAVAAWVQLHPTAEAGGIAPPESSGDAGPYPPRSEAASTPATPGPTFLVGLPGSGVERIADLLASNTPLFRGDRLQPPGVDDGFGSPDVAAELPGSPERARVIIDSWLTRLPQRGVRDTAVIDWLPWWDNALLHALRPHLPAGRLLLVVRDPRQMLLDWLAGGSAFGLRFDAPVPAARWLAGQLAQTAAVIEQDLYPVLRVDPDQAGLNDPPALADALGQAIGAHVQPSTVQWPLRLPAAHWQMYRDALGDAFALLDPVAERLGYPAR